ncbi:hypothetical protein [Streptomyces sp. AGS-58]|uniref:hypothetical protein n=1 Tax=unclassified Streptomyces TaxID=2593676 RepID=UPI0035A2E986
MRSQGLILSCGVHWSHNASQTKAPLQLSSSRSSWAASAAWRAAVPAEQRRLITSAVDSAEEQLLQLHGVQSGPTAEVDSRPVVY